MTMMGTHDRIEHPLVSNLETAESSGKKEASGDTIGPQLMEACSNLLKNGSFAV